MMDIKRYSLSGEQLSYILRSFSDVDGITQVYTKNNSFEGFLHFGHFNSCTVGLIPGKSGYKLLVVADDEAKREETQAKLEVITKSPLSEIEK